MAIMRIKDTAATSLMAGTVKVDMATAATSRMAGTGTVDMATAATSPMADTVMVDMGTAATNRMAGPVTVDMGTAATSRMVAMGMINMGGRDLIQDTMHPITITPKATEFSKHFRGGRVDFHREDKPSHLSSPDRQVERVASVKRSCKRTVRTSPALV
jgi:hypothetical protein